MNVIQIDVWIVLVAAGGVIIVFGAAAWKLAIYSSKLTIDGVYARMDKCRTELEVKIDRAQNCAENCCTRAGRIEKVLMDAGINTLTGGS